MVNYPASSKKGPNATVVKLQLVPGLPTVTQVLKPLLETVPIDDMYIMGIDQSDSYAKHGEPPLGKSTENCSSSSTRQAARFDHQVGFLCRRPVRRSCFDDPDGRPSSLGERFAVGWLSDLGQSRQSRTPLRGVGAIVAFRAAKSSVR